MIDAWLLKKFPGRTLEELDAMNWLRLMRAVEADEVSRIEEVRVQVQKKYKPSAADWRKIQSHDELYRASQQQE